MGTPLLPRVEVGPDANQATLTVIWMHGLGADGHDFEPIVPMLLTPTVRYVFPHAPVRPVTINGGIEMPAWYDILSLDDLDGRESEADIRRSQRQLQAIIDHEIEHGASYDRLVLAGFSQGGAMALHLATRTAEPLAGVMVLSAYMLVPDAFETDRSEAQRETPMFFGHGSYDPVVPVGRGRAAYEAIAAWSTAPVTWREYPMAHQVCPPQIEDIGAWLRQR